MRINEEALNSVRAQLDEEVKKLLAQKTVLAWILRRNVSEFSQMSLDDIAACIEDEPEIGTRTVNPGVANSEIAHASKEDSVPGEGRLFYDIVFDVRLPEGSEILKVIINVEAQKDYYPGYHMETRGVYYACRLISAQKHTEFEKSDYDSIKKVYSIWLCMDAPDWIGNAISEYYLCKKDIIPGLPDNRKAYDKIRIVIIALNQKMTSTDSFINFMNTLISTTMSVDEKKEKLSREFSVEAGSDMEGRLEAMCNYSDLVEEKGIEKGIGLGELRGKILARFEDGKTPEEIAGRMNLTLEQVRAVLAGQTISR